MEEGRPENALRSLRQTPSDSLFSGSAGKVVHMAEIARSTGVSRARVTQIMNLLHLPQEILAHVATLDTPEEMRLFGERNLRRLLALPTTAAQFVAFARMCDRGEMEPRIRSTPVSHVERK